MAASLANIPIMATGGIGGVHRGAEKTMDISADLQELGTTNVAVVCTGAKAILDLPKTPEYLETMGVAVIGAGTNEFPAFLLAHPAYRSHIGWMRRRTSPNFSTPTTGSKYWAAFLLPICRPPTLRCLRMTPRPSSAKRFKKDNPPRYMGTRSRPIYLTKSPPIPMAEV